MKKPRLEKVDNYQNMWRVVWPDGQRSTSVNIVRARDAIKKYNDYMAEKEMEDRP